MTKEVKKYLIQIGFGSLLYMITVVVSYQTKLAGNAKFALFFMAYAVIGFSVLEKICQNFSSARFLDENFLVVAATVGAFIIGKEAEGVAVLLLFQVGQMFEAIAIHKSHTSIAEMMDIKTDIAHRKVKGEEIQVDPKELKVGHVIVIKPGEKIPVDGIVRTGKSNVDMKALTGESTPRVVKEGDKLVSGSINLTGVIEARVARTYENSIVSRIYTLVDQAIMQKAETENYVTKFARIYTPIIICITIALMLVPIVLLPQALQEIWTYRSLTFLIVACPSAIVVSIPLAFYGGIRAASKMGVMIKGSNYLEILAKTDTFIFDKTGTLTKGVFELKEICPIEMTAIELLEITALAESYSNHPIGISICEAYGEEINKRRVKNVKELFGYGMTATVDGQKIYIGNEKLMKQRKITYEEVNDFGTIVHIVIENQYAGFMRISDSLREDAKATMEVLKEHYMASIVMLTGDNQKEADNIAEELDLDYVYANLLPEEKVNYLEDFLRSQRDQEKLAYIGEGINDAPVLARADVGIAMGGLGSAAAIEAADIVLMDDELIKIISAIKIAKETLRVVKRNTHYIIAMKMIVVMFAIVGYITMWEAVVADIGVMLVSILSSMWVAEYPE
ncbi:MAG: heavy metal translocating P-type ATPase [Lachnospiraceae bacterium]